MLKQATNLNGDDFSAPRRFDGTEAILRITRPIGGTHSTHLVPWD